MATSAAPPSDLRYRSPYDEIGFTQVTNLALMDPTLSHGAFRLYLILKSYANKGSAWPGMPRLQRLMGLGETKVRGLRKELTTRGLITTKRRGLNRTNLYWIEDTRSLYGDDEIETFWELKKGRMEGVDDSPDPYTCTDQDPQTGTGQDPHTGTGEEHPGTRTSKVRTSRSCEDDSVALPPARKKDGSARAARQEKTQGQPGEFRADDAVRQTTRNRLRAINGKHPVKKGGLKGPSIRSRKVIKRAEREGRDIDLAEAEADRRAHSPKRAAQVKRKPKPRPKTPADLHGAPEDAGEPDKGSKFQQWSDWARDQRKLGKGRATSRPIKPVREWVNTDLLGYFQDMVESYLELPRPSGTPKTKGQATNLITAVGSPGEALKVLEFFVAQWGPAFRKSMNIKSGAPTLGIVLGWLDEIRVRMENPNAAKGNTPTERTFEGKNYDEGQEGILGWE